MNAPAHSDSAAGQALLTKYFPPPELPFFFR
jgi:hypothetical protein